jgi:hypothetical protein
VAGRQQPGRRRGPRLAVYDLENEQGTPIYVHAKAVVIDPDGRPLPLRRATSL